MTGRESPYELRDQEVKRIFREIVEAKPCKPFKKYIRKAEEDIKATGHICQVCGSPEAVNQIYYKPGYTVPFTKIVCSRCGFEE